MAAFIFPVSRGLPGTDFWCNLHPDCVSTCAEGIIALTHPVAIYMHIFSPLWLSLTGNFPMCCCFFLKWSNTISFMRKPWMSDFWVSCHLHNHWSVTWSQYMTASCCWAFTASALPPAVVSDLLQQWPVSPYRGWLQKGTFFGSQPPVLSIVSVS